MPGIAASLSPSKAKLDGWKLSRTGSGFVCVLSPIFYLSISPNTMSSDPMIATVSASMWRLAITSMA